MDLDSIDKFESVFKGAVKDYFVYKSLEIKKIMVITSGDSSRAEFLLEKVRNFLRVVIREKQIEWVKVEGEDFDSVPELMEICEREKPDLIVAYRHLKQKHKKLPFSIGVYLDMLTQATKFPIMVLPYFEDQDEYKNVMNDCNAVTAVANHITTEHKLVNYGIYFTEPEGKLFLTHIEDRMVFDKYIDIISKIPELSTELAEKEIKARLFSEPAAYIESCEKTLGDRQINLEIIPVIKLGHAIEDYKAQILNHEIDLLIMNTRDEDQLAMQGMAYSLAVELTQIPLLLI